MSQLIGVIGRGMIPFRRKATTTLLTGLAAYWKLANVNDSAGTNTLTNN